MSDTAGRLNVVLDARIQQFEQKVARAEQRLLGGARNMQRSVQQVDLSFAGLSRRATEISRSIPMLGAALAGLSLGGISTMAMNAIRAAGGLRDLAQQIGVSTDALQVLNIAASQAGSNAGEVQRAVASLTRSIADAAGGNREAQQRFVDLGISFRDAQGNARSTAAVLGDLADRISRMTNPAEQAAAAAALLGSNLGQRLLPMLVQGRAGLEGVEREARRMGRVLSQETIEAANRASNAFDDMKSTAGDLATTLWSRLAPTLEAVANALRRIALGPDIATRVAELTRRIPELDRGIASLEERLQGVVPGGMRPLLMRQLEEVRRARSAYQAELDGLGRLGADAPPRTFHEPGALPPLPPRVTGQAGSGSGTEADATARRLRAVLQAEDNRLIADRTRVIEQNRTPEERYIARMERLGELVAHFAGTDDELPLPTIQAEAISALREYEDALDSVAGKLTRTQQELRRLGEQTVENFAEAVAEGRSLREVVQGLLKDLGRILLQQSVSGLGVGKMFESVVASLFGGLGGSPIKSANGNVFRGGNVVPFARGGVIDGPAVFPMRDGRTGLMGEAGPEAIVPLTRGPDGKLGVRSQGGGGAVTVTQTMHFGSDVSRAELARWGAEIERRTFASIVEARRESRRFLG